VEDGFWSPTVILVITIAMVIGFGGVFCFYAFRGYAPLQFQCRRCDRGFRRKPYARMPKTCPHCGSADWQL
jgi:hypothetical protein